jgi:hypothetical protein
MMHFGELVPAQASALVPRADRLRLAVAAYLARFKGTSRDHASSDLRCYLAWCAGRGLDPFLARRPLGHDWPTKSCPQRGRTQGEGTSWPESWPGDYGQPTPGAGASATSTCPVLALMTSSTSSVPRHSAVSMNSV